jgi:hypothetical protein
METWIQWMVTIVAGIPAFFTNPFTYLLLLVIGLQWKRQVDMERRLFSARLHTVAEGVLQSVFYGCLGGLLVSLSFIGLGVVFSLEAFLYIWIIALVLLLFHVRFLCFAYAGAILGMFALLARWFPQGQDIVMLKDIWQSLAGIYIPSLFVMVAVLHMAEALLIYLGAKRATPIFIQSKRGRLVGAYHIQHFWLVPMFLIVEGNQGSLAPLFTGWPLFSGQAIVPLSLLLLPAVLGFSEQAISSTPEQKSRFAAKWLTIYSLILLGISFAAVYVSELLLLVAIVFSFVGHEALIWYSRWSEHNRTPIYVHPPEGLKILAVIPHTPAQKMGLQAGEVIVKVNGQPVRRRKELYRSLKQNLTFCKLEVLNLDGNLKFSKSSLYEQDHHQLGVILAPDEEVPYYLESEQVNLWRLIRQRLRKKSHSFTDQPDQSGNKSVGG